MQIPKFCTQPYARFPITPIYTLYLVYKVSLLYLNVFVLTTYSYIYVAFLITTRLVYCIPARANSITLSPYIKD